jgi:hypothetical protein
MAAIKTDGTYTSATLHGAARKSFPIEGDTTAILVEQDFQIAFSSFAALAIGTAHATVTTAYLVGEGPLQDMGGGIAQWTRTYATVPANRDEFETFNYKFPGLLSTDGNPPYNQYWTSGVDGGRDPFTDTVVSRLRHEYYRVATGLAYETPQEIPILQGQEYSLTTNADARMEYLLPAGEYLADSVPTREAWETLAGGGTGLGTGTAAGELIAEDSKVERYMGNIWVRITRYIKAR